MKHSFPIFTTKLAKGVQESEREKELESASRCDTIPTNIWILGVVKFSEKFAYFGVLQILRKGRCMVELIAS